MRVNVDGKDYPICAVYMSINDSLAKVSDQITPTDAAPNNLLFPDLRTQIWFTEPGGSFAQKMASALVSNGYWEINNVKHYWGNPSTATTANEGNGFLVNANPPPGNPNQSPLSAYFLWSENGGNTNAKGKARYLWHKNGETGAAINWKASDAQNLDPNLKYWFWVLDDPAGPTSEVPGPLPLLGAGAAYGWSRRLRRRLRQSP